MNTVIGLKLGSESPQYSITYLGGSRLAADSTTKLMRLRCVAANMLVGHGAQFSSNAWGVRSPPKPLLGEAVAAGRADLEVAQVALGKRRTSFGQKPLQVLESPAGVASGMLVDKVSSTLDLRAVELHAEAKVLDTLRDKFRNQLGSQGWHLTLLQNRQRRAAGTAKQE